MRTQCVGGYTRQPRPRWSSALYGVLFLAGLVLAHAASAQQAPATHTIFMNAVEYKGSTTTEKLAPPQVNPATLSKGYVYKGPGEADKTAPQKNERWCLHIGAPGGRC